MLSREQIDNWVVSPTDNVQELAKKYPTLYDLSWGFECENGWYVLLDKLSQAILALPHSEHVRVVQVKEKYGTLRYYFHVALELDDPDAYNDIYNAINPLVEQAELLSSRICEVCGEPGKTRGQSWYRTTCDAHA